MNLSASDLQRGFLIGIVFCVVATRSARWIVHRVTMARLRKLASAQAGTQLEHTHCKQCTACLVRDGGPSVLFRNMTGCAMCGALLRRRGDSGPDEPGQPGERYDEWQACDACGAPRRARP